MHFVLIQRDGKYVYSITESGWYFSVFCSHDIRMPFFYFTLMAYDSPPYYSNYGMMIFFLAYKVFKSQYLFHT